MLNFTKPIPLSLYIHLPWCVKKCPYCDFNSHALRNDLPEKAYVAALISELDSYLPHVWGRRLTSIFFGGGTPSLFSPQAIETILSAVHARFNFGTDLEITLEANPGTIDESRFKGFRHAGVNRLSIGIQSLHNEKLKILGRIHDRDHALRAITAALSAGFNNFNLDLMHGLPQQTVTEALQDLHDALQFQPKHLSWYQLTLEPNTLFHQQPPSLPEEAVLFEIQEQGKELIQNNGLLHYEVSAYAKENFTCAHNKNYWEFGDYLGIGAGAHSKITDVSAQTIVRFSQVKNPKDYLTVAKRETFLPKVLSEQDIVFEFMLNALRLIEGVSVELFHERTGLPFAAIQSIAAEAKQKKLLVDDEKRLCATELGQRFLNDLVGMFLKT